MRKLTFLVTFLLAQTYVGLNAQEKQTPDVFDGYKEFKFFSIVDNYKKYNYIKIKEEESTIIYSLRPTPAESRFLETTINEVWLSCYKNNVTEIVLFLNDNIEEIISKLFTEPEKENKTTLSQFDMDLRLDSYYRNEDGLRQYNESRKRNHLGEGEAFGYEKPFINEDWSEKINFKGNKVIMTYGLYEKTRTTCTYTNRSELNWDSNGFEKVYKYNHESIKKSFYLKLNVVNYKNIVDSAQVKANYNNYLNELGIDNNQKSINKPVIKKDNKSINKSDVDENIPVTGVVNKNSFALIIGNENYTKEISVPFAINDATIFKKYLNLTLGVPNNNIHFLLDASYGSIIDEIEWVKNIIKAYKNETKIFIYYAGHGVPNEQTKNAYILPIDGSSSNTKTCIPLDGLLKELTEENAKSVTLFIDACFSGDSRGGMLTQARGVKIKPKTTALTGNIIVFSATTDDETAKPYEEKSHGLFTYFLLKKIQETQGLLSYEVLYNYLSSNVLKQSLIINNKKQTPQINVSSSFENNWKLFQLR